MTMLFCYGIIYLHNSLMKLEGEAIAGSKRHRKFLPRLRIIKRTEAAELKQEMKAMGLAELA